MRLKPIIQAKANANLKASGENFGKGVQKSANPIEPIKTRTELAKLAGVSHDTIKKWRSFRPHTNLIRARVKGALQIRTLKGVHQIDTSSRVATSAGHRLMVNDLFTVVYRG